VSHPTSKELRDRAKAMRSAPTEAEHRLWQILRATRLSGYKFRRQMPLDHYIVDFVCLAHRLVIEADGGQHSQEADARRDAHIRSQDFRILRFWNDEIFTNEEGVTTAILDALSTPLPNPSPARGEGLEGTLHA
jgi:very-short-patch-repair endonuclease